ncbi:MAG: hypothetical protein ABI165_11145, partial [Bryobacteraceae bacterium]
VELRGEAFNLFNAVTYGVPGADISIVQSFGHMSSIMNVLVTPPSGCDIISIVKNPKGLEASVLLSGRETPRINRFIPLSLVLSSFSWGLTALLTVAALAYGQNVATGEFRIRSVKDHARRGFENIRARSDR